MNMELSDAVLAMCRKEIKSLDGSVSRREAAPVCLYTCSFLLPICLQDTLDLDHRYLYIVIRNIRKRSGPEFQTARQL